MGRHHTRLPGHSRRSEEATRGLSARGGFVASLRMTAAVHRQAESASGATADEALSMPRSQAQRQCACPCSRRRAMAAARIPAPSPSRRRRVEARWSVQQRSRMRLRLAGLEWQAAEQPVGVGDGKRLLIGGDGGMRALWAGIGLHRGGPVWRSASVGRACRRHGDEVPCWRCGCRHLRRCGCGTDVGTYIGGRRSDDDADAGAVSCPLVASVGLVPWLDLGCGRRAVDVHGRLPNACAYGWPETRRRVVCWG